METMENQTPWAVSEIGLIYKTTVDSSVRPKIATSEDAAKVFRAAWDHATIALFEQFKVIFLDRAGYVIAIYGLATGGRAGVAVDPMLIFAAALKLPTNGIVLAHNHPSGQLIPSQQDISLTNKLKDGGVLLGIEVLDHIIMTANSYYSFADNGRL